MGPSIKYVRLRGGGVSRSAKSVLLIYKITDFPCTKAHKGWMGGPKYPYFGSRYFMDDPLWKNCLVVLIASNYNFSIAVILVKYARYEIYVYSTEIKLIHSGC